MRIIEKVCLNIYRGGGKRPYQLYSVSCIPSRDRDFPIKDLHHLQPISSINIKPHIIYGPQTSYGGYNG